MKRLSIALFVFFAFGVISSIVAEDVFNVLNYGARSDGVSDNSEAFYKAWKDGCESENPSVVEIPRGWFYLKEMGFMGPCKSPIKFDLQGVLIAPTYDNMSDSDRWIKFKQIDQLTIDGGGSLDGQGPTAWPHNDCKWNPTCKHLPTSLRLDYVNNSMITNISSYNSKNIHIKLYASRNITLDRLQVIAPGDSPNTDGIQISSTQNVQISNTIIQTGDDCIAMLPGTENVNISSIQCGPGHGISIGSLGGRPNEKDVQEIYIRNCNFTDTSNGFRIKTWGKPFRGKVTNVTFDGIRFFGVHNPIIIDQKYCPSKNCNQVPSGVKITDVRFNDIRGTSYSQIAVNLICSKENPCDNITMRDINIGSHGGTPVKSYCENVRVTSSGQVSPPPCLQQNSSLQSKIME